MFDLEVISSFILIFGPNILLFDRKLRQVCFVFFVFNKAFYPYLTIY